MDKEEDQNAVTMSEILNTMIQEEKAAATDLAKRISRPSPFNS